MSEARTPDARTDVLCVENARIVAPEAVVEGHVLIEGERIAAVAEGSPPASVRSRLDADGKFLLPGLVDLHGDDVESHLYPRSGARVGTPMALAAADRANVAAGVTTKFHAVAFEDSPEKDRSTDLATELVDAIASTGSLLGDHFVHARCELTERESVVAVERILERRAADLVSLMCHVPGKGQFRDRDRFLRWYVDHAGLSREAAAEILDERAALSDGALSDRIARIVAAAREAGVAVASHDDETPVEVERLDGRGVGISEYPVTIEAARRAHELGLTTAMGAPNLVRGGSNWGNLSTAEAIAEGVVDALCADYHPPSLLAAPFVETGEPLPTRVARVTKNPAQAVGLTDRGQIEPGARADLVVVDPEPTPVVERAVVAGREVYRAVGGCGTVDRGPEAPRTEGDR
ncbi:alpha-D-ribose 1-methylphosphonate 5-triphosphate diphosphatase [Halegenticoccus tardaugens]|uniref:alpha-D-ribose 1-methylphosphonate 5-triphosphate diphosphatase n=1 Tax=Halegenticoccus tardaugens TaxID=2071624 RepID=UPI00100AC57A|nr:alpha-D-ribose 1-methylphosphonate 5-triphosphate diphosphatase [Halegenticoccus tardaugens]